MIPRDGGTVRNSGAEFRPPVFKAEVTYTVKVKVGDKRKVLEGLEPTTEGTLTIAR